MERRSTQFQVEPPGAISFYPSCPIYQLSSQPLFAFCLPCSRSLSPRNDLPSSVVSTYHQIHRLIITTNNVQQTSLVTPIKLPALCPHREPLFQLFLKLLNANLIARVPPKPTSRPPPKGYNPNLCCASHMNASRCDTIDCWGPKHKV